MARTAINDSLNTGRPQTVRISPPRQRRKSLRQHFRDGLEAGLKAEPEAFAATKPRTMMGLMVRNLICAAASARCDAVRLVFAYADPAALAPTEGELAAALDDSQGISGPEASEQPNWDWDGEAGWDSTEREKKPGELDAERAARTQALREELYEQFIRAAEGERENEERLERLAAERGERPIAPDVQFSGNSAPDLAGTVRIGGRIVER